VLVSVAVFKEPIERNVTPALSQWLKQPPHSKKLAPTVRSAIHA
jgi:hypothetical protein